MNVASLELCKELYDLSAWETEYGWMKFGKHLSGNRTTWTIDARDISDFPAYDLGYLMRKLPPATNIFITGRDYGAKEGNFSKKHRMFFADTPEDAAAKLAIELFKQGILTKEPS